MSELIDNRARKIATLKGIIQHLHKGEAPEAVKSQLREMVRQTNPSEIMAMEQELISEGMPVEAVKSMCDLHSQVTREVLVQIPASSIAPGHPVDTFRRENAAIREVIAKIRATFHEISTRPEREECAPQLLQIKQNANELMDIDKHYQRKEHALFACLERHDISGPSKVMWAKDDDIRTFLKCMNQAAHVCAPTIADCKNLATGAILPACR